MPTWATILVEVLKLAIAFATLGSIYLAYKTYQANVRKQDEDRVRDSDKELLAQAKQSLKWAYNALTEEDTNVPPRANRLNWLTAARHLLRHKKLAAQIRSDTFKTVHSEIEEHWRHQFYLALDHNQLAEAAYFRPQQNTRVPEQIFPVSAMVIVEFSAWPKDRQDPLDEVDKVAMEAKGQCFSGRAGRGLRSYMELLGQAAHEKEMIVKVTPLLSSRNET
jgi:hypothetical protein